MGRYIVRRLIHSVVILLILSLVIFVLTDLMPGNVVSIILGTEATESARKALEQQLGLDKPASYRYINWLGNMLKGDFGESLRMHKPIASILGWRLLNSLYLAGVSFLLIAVIGIGIGTIAGLRQGSTFDSISTPIMVMGSSLPEFVTGTILVLLFSTVLQNVLPTSGYARLTDGFIDWLKHLLLPTLTLSLILIGYVARMTRASVIQVLGSDYIRTARLKGMPERTVIIKHVLPNALPPTITVLFMNLGWLFGGIVVVEQVFVYPGIGRLMLFAITERDWPLIQACGLVIASVYVIGNLISDLLQLAMNPRSRDEVIQ